ncbi:Pre-mRNA cleavage complex II protein Clp1-domain-containing protein [Jimgerdemannia flammicorona]|uniref:Pre-mRNA cleavage complex II protein Clp1-domain-containing protein n=2 Tax=Jimgerdemannia flammicorona TaxID=994334 RepID=A0A433QC79_9FUNG|nr:Pre-mRNA cleavage complex II protein Clp1-domain-containing protein [Jimgerdemannia flammicorona]RUS27416.1 Pre-mRNA cleavage complex II protein Clp1-domain-containing protein [Jimgerdemannia flammicorona]
MCHWIWQRDHHFLTPTIQPTPMNSAARIAGLIIDTTGLIDHVGYEIIQHAIEEFSVNVIIALGHERLYSDMVRILKDNQTVSVIKLAKSGGVVERDASFRRQTQMHKIQEYFYGTPKCDLLPYSTFINFNDVSIFRVGEGSLAPSSALPLGMDRAVSETQLCKVDAGDILLNSVLAVSNAESAEDENGLIEANLAGFIYIRGRRGKTQDERTVAVARAVTQAESSAGIVQMDGGLMDVCSFRFRYGL